MTMPGEVRAIHSWQLRVTVIEVRCMAVWVRSRSQTHPNRHHPSRIQLLGSLASEVEVDASWNQKSGHQRVFLLPISIPGSK